jgi:putative oxidoreductase
MRFNFLESRRDELMLIARVLLMILFVVSGFNKLMAFSGTTAYMAAKGLPMPTVTAGIVVFLELVVGIAIAVGHHTRQLALLMAIYTLGTALIAHHFWTMAGPERIANMINFYKNVSIMGGLLMLSASGPGRYSFDRK